MREVNFSGSVQVPRQAYYKSLGKAKASLLPFARSTSLNKKSAQWMPLRADFLESTMPTQVLLVHE